MSDIAEHRLRTADLDEAIDAVTKIYCPHSVRIHGSNRGLSSALDVNRAGQLRIVDLKYSTRVRIDAGDFDRLMLIMSCTSGSAAARQGCFDASWSRGQTVPLSPQMPSELDFDAEFAQRSVRIDLGLLDTLCSRRVGRPLGDPVRFLLQPFSDELEKAWRHATDLAMSYAAAGIELPLQASNALNEFMLSLLLDMAPHNYSDEIRAPHPLAAPRALREAERLMRDVRGVGSVHDIAAAAGLSLRSLEAGFREWKKETPLGFMRRLRLTAVREQLLQRGARTTVADVALSFGFLHLPRFAQYYRAAFNELPSETLRLTRHRTPGRRPPR